MFDMAGRNYRPSAFRIGIVLVPLRSSTLRLALTRA
jgi:hypothetical protein